MPFPMKPERVAVLFACVVFLTAGFSVSVLAQDVGMGTRVGGTARFEEPYTLEIETPHVKWAKPMEGGPIRVLAVPSVQEGRTLVELAQRFDLELTTVSIDPAWDVNKWTMAFGDDYGSRAEQGDLQLVYRYLEEELTSDKVFDVIFLPLHHGWEALTEASRTALRKRVENGCGLVLVRPFDSEISPLVGGESEAPERPYAPVEPLFESSPWKRLGDHYITRAIPVEAFPFQFIEHYRYQVAAGCQVLVEAASGVPVLAERSLGRGRVVAFGFRNIGMSWRMPLSTLAEPVDVYWEYFYALLGRALIYSSRREPTETPVFDTPEQQWTLRNEVGEVVRTGTGVAPSRTEIPAGRHFLELHVNPDWMITLVDNPQTDAISGIEVSPGVISEGDMVTVRFTATGTPKVELEDGLGRLIARTVGPEGAGEKEIQLKAGRPLTHGGFVRVTVGTASVSRMVEFAASSRVWNDYEVIMPWYGPNSYQPWTPALDHQFRNLGITTMEDPERPFKIIASVHEPAFGIYWYRRGNYEKRKAEYLKTGDKSLIRRDVALHSATLLDDVEKRFKARVGELLPLRPFAYYLADESSLTCYADAWDVDWSPETLTAFRRWLQPRYGDELAALNQAWNTHFETWDSVVPMTAPEAQEHGNYAPWSEHRVFMEETFIDTVKRATEMAHRLDPEGLASFSGTQVPTAHNGCNWYEIDRLADYLQPYSGGNQDAMHHLFNPNLRLTGFTGYGLTEADVQQQVWRRLFYGHAGASIFWHYTLMNPDLTYSSQGKGLARAFRQIQSGIGRIFMNSRVVEDGVAIHFSMASIRGAWITDGKIREGVVSATSTSENFKELMKRRDDWVQALEKRGIQFRFLATPQVEAGALKDFKLLILPYSIALSNQEIEEINRFTAGGGQVIFDEQTGKMDEKCRWRQGLPWPAPGSGFSQTSPADLDLERSFDVKGTFLTTIRSFGENTLYGLLPDSRERIQLPKTNAIRYNLLSTGEATASIEASPDQPVLLVERKTRIETIEIDRDLNVYLKDENGHPIGRSVVSVKVLDPARKEVVHYSANIDIEDGAGTIEIPFAISDPKGDWTIIAKDVISGLETSLTLSR